MSYKMRIGLVICGCKIVNYNSRRQTQTPCQASAFYAPDQLPRDPSPSSCAVDSQSTKKGRLVKLDTRLDGGKLVNGRKRHLAVDTLGLPLAIFISAANIHDGQASVELLPQLDRCTSRLKLIRGDEHYGGYFKACAAIYK